MRVAWKRSLLLVGGLLAGGVFAMPTETATPTDGTDEAPAAAGLIANGDFESEPTAGGRPAGWYYLHQARVAPHNEAKSGRNGRTAQRSVPTTKEGHDEGKGGRHKGRTGQRGMPATKGEGGANDALRGNCLLLANTVPGRESQAQQAFSLDGRKIRQLDVSFWTKAQGVRPGQSIEQRPQLAISFFDESKSSLGQQQVGPWFGSFDWQHKEGTFVVPAATRTAIVWVGLFGGTGEAAFDNIEIRAADVNPTIFTPAAD